MSVGLRLSSLSKNLKNKIKSELVVTSSTTQYQTKPIKYYVYNTDSENDGVYIPIGKYKDYLDEFPSSLDEYPSINLKFKYDLLTKETDSKKRDQNVVAEEMLESLNTTHTAFAACHTGFGKTSLGIYLTCEKGKKTGILCHNDTIKNQWKDEFHKFVGKDNVKIQIVSGKKPLDKTADVYIFGILKAAKFSRDELEDIGTLIIDEAHICTITAFTNSLLKFQPYYLIGFSATPERADGLHSLLNVYFGDKFVVREERKNFTVIKHYTKYAPEVSYQIVNGMTVLAWTDMMTSLAVIEERSIEIAELALKYPDNKIIILCDRISTIQYIYDYLEKKGESVELLMGNKKTWDKSKRVLVAGVKKGGVGLNDPELDMLIIASDMKNVKQCEGRIRTHDNIVIDIVDRHPALEKHWLLREKWYRLRGATIVMKEKKPTRFLGPCV